MNTVRLNHTGTVLAYFIMPESMHRSPAEIQQIFADVLLRCWRGYKTAVKRGLDTRIELHEI